MDVRVSVSLAAVGIVGAVGFSTASIAQRTPIPPGAPQCRHDAPEQRADRVRREGALTLAKAINAAEGALAEQTRRYHPLAKLRALPEVPAGFELRFYSDDAGYMFAIKDTLDSCRYAVFSDQVGLLYEKSALTAPEIATEP